MPQVVRRLRGHGDHFPVGGQRDLEILAQRVVHHIHLLRGQAGAAVEKAHVQTLG